MAEVSKLSEAASILSGGPEQKPESEAEELSSEQESTESEEISSAESTADSQESQSEEQESTEESGPLTLKRLAEKLGMPVKELYDVEIPVKNGEPFKLGDIKERMQDLLKVDGLLARSEVDIASAEREIMVQRDALTIHHQRAGLTEADLTEARAARAEYVSRETALTMLAIPAWRDSAIADTERLMIATELAKSGFSNAEIDNYVDHRNLALVRRLVRLEKLVKGAGDEEVKPKRPQKPASRRKTSVSTQDKIMADRKAGKLTEQEAIRALLS